jgi:hypothetical protein
VRQYYRYLMNEITMVVSIDVIDLCFYGNPVWYLRLRFVAVTNASFCLNDTPRTLYNCTPAIFPQSVPEQHSNRTIRRSQQRFPSSMDLTCQNLVQHVSCEPALRTNQENATSRCNEHQRPGKKLGSLELFQADMMIEGSHG